VLELAAVDEVLGVEVFDLAPFVDGVGGSIEGLDLGDAGLAGDEVFPELFNADAD